MAGGLLGRQFLQMVAIPPDKLLFNAELLKTDPCCQFRTVKLGRF